jgi:hypothetical protein
MKKIYLYPIIFALIIYIVFSHNGNKVNKNKTALKNFIYDNSTVLNIIGKMPESLTYTILSPQCIFQGNYTKHDCKSYTNLFLDLNCTLNQNIQILDKDGNPDYYLYMGLEFYDARLDIYNKTYYSQISLSPGIACQSNNVCVFVVDFILSYKDWGKVPLQGNNVTLNCSKFAVYSQL